MGFGMEEEPFSPELRSRNRRLISAAAVVSVAAALIASAVSTWPLKNALGICGLLVIFYASLWWMFASRRAGHLRAPTSWPEWRKRLNL